MKTACDSRTQPACPGGFTFLEIMIAIMIISIVFTAVFHLQARNISLADSMKFKSTAARLARSKLTQIIREAQIDSDSQGAFETPFEAFSWACSMDGFEPSDPDLVSDKRAEQLKNITISITQDLDTFTLSTWRYFPDETD